MVNGGDGAGSSESRASRNQNLGKIKNRASDTLRMAGVPEGCFAVADILSLPFDHIKNMQDTIVAPVFVEDAV
jgi:hypothetical protein